MRDTITDAALEQYYSASDPAYAPEPTPAQLIRSALYDPHGGLDSIKLSDALFECADMSVSDDDSREAIGDLRAKLQEKVLEKILEYIPNNRNQLPEGLRQLADNLSQVEEL